MDEIPEDISPPDRGAMREFVKRIEEEKNTEFCSH